MILTNRDLKFRFYSVLKNEDAPPYLSDNLLAVADGLGGSGSTVHRIDYSKYSDFRGEILDSAFGDMSGEGRAYLDGYISELLEAMADNIGDTSALWASRIAIARFVYAIITDASYTPDRLRYPEVRRELADFVKRGLVSVAERFGFESGKISGQILLPTTLTAIRTKEYENSVRAEVMWVGDSRAYAFTEEGMKLLSVDDEDESGCITNIFDGREGKRARINYRVYQIPKPCMLMTVSDGVFDPFDPDDNLGVEHLFLSVLTRAAGASDMGEALRDIYGKIHGDDATVSLKAFGFASFEEIRKKYASRAEYISSVYKKLEKMKPTLEVLNSTEDDVSSYILQRTEDKYARISELLLDKYARGGSDIILESKPVREWLDSFKKEAEKEENINAAAAAPDAYESLKKELLKNPSKLESMLISRGRDERECILIGRALKRSDMVTKAASEYEERCAAYRSHLEERGSIRAEITHLIDLFTKKIDSIAASADKSNMPECKALIERCSELNYRRSFWQKLLIHFDFEQVVEKNVKLSQDETHLFNAVNANTRVLIMKRHEVFTKGNYYSANKSLHEADISRLLGYVKEVGKPELFFTRDVAELLSKRPEAPENTPSGKEGDPLALLLSSEPRAVVKIIAETLAQRCHDTSVIDSCYNATRLENFRQYFRTKSGSNEEALRFEAELLALDESYNDMKPIGE